VLEYLAGAFQEGVEYDEREVQEKLRAYHDDYVSLRRYLVDEQLLERSHGVYRRPGRVPVP
jgi:hypothetical protein